MRWELKGTFIFWTEGVSPLTGIIILWNVQCRLTLISAPYTVSFRRRICRWDGIWRVGWRIWCICVALPLNRDRFWCGPVCSLHPLHSMKGEDPFSWWCTSLPRSQATSMVSLCIVQSSFSDIRQTDCWGRICRVSSIFRNWLQVISWPFPATATRFLIVPQFGKSLPYICRNY